MCLHSWFVPEIINLIYCATKLEGRVCKVYFYPFVYLLIYHDFATKWAGVFAWLVHTYEIIKLIYCVSKLGWCHGVCMFGF